MPTFSFQCGKCKGLYDDIAPYDPKNKYPGVVCPECGSKRKKKLLTAGNFMFSQPEGTSRWISDAKGHDFRYHHNEKNVRAERAAAEAASHVGSSPYNKIDDLNRNDVWGDVR